MAANLLFNDEFNSFDPYSKTDTWTTSYHWGTDAVINGEKAYYVDTENQGTTGPAGGVNPFTTGDGTLTITAAPASGLPTGQPYTSGVISSMGSFERQYGYYEMRADLPGGNGFWPAFWLMPSDKVSPPELDIMEYATRLPNEYATTAHSSADGYKMFQEFQKNLPDLSQGFHTFAVDWQADKITWFLDHAPVYQIDTPADFHKPMYILINQAAGGGGTWIGDPDGSTQHYKVDYVRVYDRNPDAASGAAQADQAEVYNHLVASQAPAAAPELIAEQGFALAQPANDAIQAVYADMDLAA